MTNTEKGRKKMAIILTIVGIVVVVAAVFLLTSLYINLPTKGDTIAEYSSPKQALLVIDVQNDITNSQSYSGTSEFVDNVNHAITLAQKSGMEILYIRNEYGNNPIISLLSGGTFKKGTEGAAFDSRLHVDNENIFTKSVGDSFSVLEFEQHLIAHEVDTLYIVGGDAAACVYSTAKGGINRNYDVTVIDDAIITRDIMGDTAMEKLREQYAKDGIQTIGLNNFITIDTPKNGSSERQG